MIDPHTQLEKHARDLLARIIASPRRRRAMQEELAAHLISSYEEELAQRHDARAAANATLHRFGHAADLRHQFQSSVPAVEYMIFFLCTKENAMSRWIFLLIGIVVSFFGTGLILPALAKQRDHGGPWSEVALFLAMGLVITLAGIGTIVYAIARRDKRAA